MQVKRRIKQSEKISPGWPALNRRYLVGAVTKLYGCWFYSLMEEGEMNAHRHLSCNRVAGSVVYDLWCSMLLDADTVTLGCRWAHMWFCIPWPVWRWLFAGLEVPIQGQQSSLLVAAGGSVVPIANLAACLWTNSNCWMLVSVYGSHDIDAYSRISRTRVW